MSTQTHQSSAALRALAATSIAVLLVVMPRSLSAAEPTLGPGDTVRVVVAEDANLTTEARLSTDGTLGMPLVGSVHIGSHTAADAARLIAEALSHGNFLRNPHVSVSVVEPRSQHVLVLGQVAHPGQYPLDGGSDRLTDFLALAGGRTENGADDVVVTRREGGNRHFDVDMARMYRNGDLSGDVELANGDVVFVPEAPVFYVYGAVQHAGKYRLEPGTSVRAALSLGGGLTERGSQHGILIHRVMPDGSTREVHAKLTDALQANDVVYVKESLF